MASGGGDLEAPLGRLLSAHLAQIERSRSGLGARSLESVAALDRRDSIDVEEMFEGLGKRPDSDHGYRVQGRGLAGVLDRQDELAHPKVAAQVGDREASADRPKTSVQTELTAEQPALQTVVRKLFQSGEKSESDRQVQVVTGLANVGGSQVDHDRSRGQGETAVADRGSHPLAALANRGVGQSDDLHLRQTILDVDLDVDRPGLDSPWGGGCGAREHVEGIDAESRVLLAVRRCCDRLSHRIALEREKGPRMKFAVGCLLVVVLLAGVVAFWVYGSYNGLVGAEESVTTAWAQVETAYQRRADLIPNLVTTVKGAAEFEQETLNQVIEARSKATRVGIEASPDLLNSPEAFSQFQQAQDGLSSALSRLLVVVERYPELRAVAAFQDLMVQLEGTENRISVERNRFNEAARAFNTRIRRVPTAWFINMLGWPFEAKSYFASQPGAEEAPAVEF